ncbi:hypothetical protein JZ751_007100 [Albula glossodonta]|uniref:Securin n=1 Tax=Albula glossodonta TaxID=121402 RepID=A0A8T2P680_9TELE|nr:hypothetical protein JZ751_007100 [Albula glossodonta]
MATMIYIDKENGALHTPAPSKQRGRFHSAPGSITADNCLKTPMTEKRFGALPKSGRRALGTVNKISSASLSSSLAFQEKKKTQAVLKEKVKTEAPIKEEEYPETENLITYDPREFETCEVPEEVRLSHLNLAGLARCSRPREDDFEFIEPFLELSPMKMPKDDYSAELDSFLQTISELTVDLPPEMEY